MNELEKRLQEKENEESLEYHDRQYERLLAYNVSMQEKWTPEERRYNDLLARLVKGAGILERMSHSNPNYDKYMKVYDRICEQIAEIKV